MKSRFYGYYFLVCLSYIVVLLIPIIITVFVYARSEHVLRVKVEEANVALLRQTGGLMDQRLDEIGRLSDQIRLNSQSVKLSYTSGRLYGRNTIDAVNLLSDFSSYKNITPFISSFFVYYRNLDCILTPSAATSAAFYYRHFIESDESWADWKSEKLLSAHSSGQYERIRLRGAGEVLAFWSSISTAGGGETKGAVCILVDIDSLRDLFAGVETLYDGKVYVLGDGKRVILSSGEEDALRAAFPESALADGRWEGDLDGESHIYTSYLSPSSGLTYVMAIPRAVMLSDVETMRYVATVAVYVGIALAVVLIAMIAYRTYRSVRSITMQFDEDSELVGGMNAMRYIEHSVRRVNHWNRQFRDTLERQQPLFRSAFLLKLIHGSVESEGEFRESCASYGLSFSHPLFAALIIRVEDSSGFVLDSSEREHNYVKLIISNVSEELSEELGVGYAAETEPGSTCLILNLPAGTTSDRIERLAQKIKFEIGRYFSIILTISIGKRGDSFRFVNASYLNAVSALNYRLLRGVSSVINAEEISHSSGTYSYPLQTENHLFSHVRSGDYQQAEKLILDLFDENFKRRSLSFPIGRCLFFDIISTALKLLDSLDVDYNTVFGDSHPVDRLLECDTVDKGRQTLLYIFHVLCEHINQNKKSHNNDLRDEIRSFITERYANPSLSQTMIAEHFGISPNYLSNFFHEQTGMRMTEFIQSVRIEHAKELLVSTDGNIASIAAQTGFSSDLALSRTFKKQVGLPPGQYRVSSAE